MDYLKPVPLKIAPMGRRVVAAIIDGTIVGLAFVYAVMRWGEETSPGQWSLTGLPAILLFAMLGMYWFIPMWFWGTSFGKWSLGLKVLKRSGMPIGLIEALKRNLLRMVDGIGFYLVGFIVAKSNPLRQRTGDLWAKTVVVTAEQASTYSSEPTAGS